MFMDNLGAIHLRTEGNVYSVCGWSIDNVRTTAYKTGDII